MDESHRCGPSPEQVQQALTRGETLGTCPRCAECAEREERLLSKVRFVAPVCPAHSVPEPCPTCRAYIAAGL